VNEPGAHTSNLIGADGRTHSTTAERYSTFHRAGGNGSGQWNHVIRVIVSGARMKCTEVDNLIGSPAQQIRYLLLQGEPSMVRRDSYAHYAFSLR
jgi:hypothetical protein